MGIYLTWLADVLREAGLTVVETDGWETRARSSGGFPETPLGIQWHHTASQTTPQNDVNYQINADDAPIGNMTLMRDGSVWLIAAGAANTAGKGGPLTLSRGTIPLDSANTRTVAMEVANNGVGEKWPEVQVNAYFTCSNAINKRLGNLPSDVFTHAIGTGNGWTDRKIDPATAAAVQGPWKPRSVSGSGTWSLDDIRAECMARAGQQVPPTTPTPQPPEPTPVPPKPFPPEPTPEPPSQNEDEMLVVALDKNGTAWVGNGVKRIGIPNEDTFLRYQLVWGTRFVNVSGQPVKNWGDVGAAVDSHTLNALGAE